MDQVGIIKAELSRFTYNDFLRHLATVKSECRGGKQLRVAVLRSYTAEPIQPVLDVRLRLGGFEPEFFFGGFNQYVQEILDPTSALYQFRPDVVLLLVRTEELLPDFVASFGDAQADWAQAIEAKAMEVADLLRVFRERSTAQILIQNLCLPSGIYWGIRDAQLEDGQGQLLHSFNRILARCINDIQGCFIWAFDRLVQRIGYERLYDPKMFYLSRNPFSQQACPEIAADLDRYLSSMLGPSKKCIVVDLDNTLWGGVIGEDGMQGIKLGHDYPGNCYRAFQAGLLRLFHRGLILAINSKNNPSDALRVIDEHPDMLLRRKHFADMRINWDDKASNMRSIARTLNIGLESMVMIDDSESECDLIRRSIKECEVYCLPPKPYLIPEVLDQIAGIENIRLTDEDRQKGTMYQAQAARREHEANFTNLEEFLETLELQVDIAPASSFSTPRIAQLTQKTNQFNLTTRRYTDSDIEAFAASDSASVYSVSVSDRFGEYGIVGVMIVKYLGTDARIDTLLLSCRVIGKNVETCMVTFLAEAAKARDMKRLFGEFIDSGKNAPAAGLFDKCGFEHCGESEFVADLERSQFEWPPYIRRVRVGDN